MRIRHALAAITLLACFCSKPEKAPPPKGTLSAALNAAPLEDRQERVSLLNMANGTTIVSRTGETNLQFSAVGLIDGDPTSSWISPPEDLQQSIVIALPARSAIEKIGIRTTTVKTQAARTVRLDTSLDGREYVALATATMTASEDVQWPTVPPREAAFVRVSTIDGNGRYVQLNSIVATGRVVEDFRPREIQGCWTINGRKARFEQEGARVTGVIEDRIPMFVEGGSDGRLVRLSWVKGPQFGMAAVTLTPDSRTLSGMKWHEVPVTEFFGEAWFGEKTDCERSRLAPHDVFGSLFAKTKAESTPLYGLMFDAKGNLDVPASENTLQLLPTLFANPVKLVAREFRLEKDADNLAISKTRIQSLRAELERRAIDLENVSFVGAGTQTRRVKPRIEITRDLHSTVEVEK